MKDKLIHYETGDGVIIPPLKTHRCAPKDINHWAYVILFVDPSYYSDVISFSQAKKLTGNQVQKLIDFIEQLLVEKNPDTLENILVELLLEFGETDISEVITTDTRDIELIHEYILNHGNDFITLDKIFFKSATNAFLSLYGMYFILALI